MKGIINKPIFKVSIKNNWAILTTHFLIAAAFTALIRVTIASSLSSDNLSDKAEKGFRVVDSMVSLFENMGGVGIFGILVLIFLVIVGGGFINRPALDGSLSTYLTVPVSRKKYAITTLAAYYTMIIGLILAVTLAGLLFILSVTGVELRAVFIGNYFAVAGVFTLMSLTVAAISYFSAAVFAGTKVKGMYVLIPIAFVVLSTFASMGSAVEGLKFLKYLTPYSWFNFNYIFRNNIPAEFIKTGGFFPTVTQYEWWDKNPWLPGIICLAVIAVCSVVSVIVYRKKKFAV